MAGFTLEQKPVVLLCMSSTKTLAVFAEKLFLRCKYTALILYLELMPPIPKREKCAAKGLNKTMLR
jgi:hypothetical protein